MDLDRLMGSLKGKQKLCIKPLIQFLMRQERNDCVEIILYFLQEVELPVTHDELHAKSLCVSVWDWSQTMRNTNIGM